jgi:hypothetical protein
MMAIRGLSSLSGHLAGFLGRFRGRLRYAGLPLGLAWLRVARLCGGAGAQSARAERGTPRTPIRLAALRRDPLSFSLTLSLPTLAVCG